MMREILFRGKDEDTGEWLQSMTISKHYYNDEEIFSYYIGHGNRTIDAKTLGQYTGLTDKNGTKIFEGDIVQSIELELKGIIVFDEHCRFMIKEVPTGATYLISYNCDEIKVIGNIHDNPELMKGGAE